MAARQARNTPGHGLAIMAMVAMCGLAVQIGVAGGRLNQTLQPNKDDAAGKTAETPILARWQARRETIGCIDADETRLIDSYRTNPRAQLKALIPRRMAKVCLGIRRGAMLSEHKGHAADDAGLMLLAGDDGRLIHVPRTDVERVED